MNSGRKKHLFLLTVFFLLSPMVLCGAKQTTVKKDLSEFRKEFLGQEQESAAELWEAPSVGEEAPEFALKTLRGKEVRLSDFHKKKPVVLVTGSLTCPIYRKNLVGLQRLYERYGGRAAFFVLYTVEAHPVGSVSPYADREWLTQSNQKDGILIPQPADYAGRVKQASRMRQMLSSTVPVLVDEMDNAVWTQYGSAPNAAYYIDSRGVVQVRQDWFDPLGFERKFLGALQEEPPRWK